MINNLFRDQIRRLKDVGLLELEEKSSYTAEEMDKIQTALLGFFKLLLYSKKVTNMTSNS